MSRHADPLPFSPLLDFTVQKPFTLNGRQYQAGETLDKKDVEVALLRKLYTQRRITATEAKAVVPPAKKTAPKAKPVPTGKGAPMLIGSGHLPAVIEIGQNKYALGAIVAAAHLASELDADGWNDQTQEQIEGRLAAEIEKARAGKSTAQPLPKEEPPTDNSEAQGQGSGTEFQKPFIAKFKGFGKWYVLDAAGAEVSGPHTEAEAKKLAAEAKKSAS